MRAIELWAQEPTEWHGFPASGPAKREAPSLEVPELELPNWCQAPRLGCREFGSGFQRESMRQLLAGAAPIPPPGMPQTPTWAPDNAFRWSFARPLYHNACSRPSPIKPRPGSSFATAPVVALICHAGHSLATVAAASAASAAQTAALRAEASASGIRPYMGRHQLGVPKSSARRISHSPFVKQETHAQPDAEENNAVE